MKDLIRVVLVDPSEESRGGIQRLLGSLASLWIAEVLADYRSAAVAVAEVNPNLCLVNVDSDPAAGIELITSLSQSCPGVVVLPASATADGTLILKAIRAGAREFLALPAEAGELLETIGRLFRGREDSQATSENGPQTIV